MDKIDRISGCLSTFISETQIVRSGEFAEIIVGIIRGREIKLIAFNTESFKSDFEIYEEGYFYLQSLVKHIRQRK